jgi:protein-S-isoprenylcysteine O-methyltransferase Ste14
MLLRHALSVALLPFTVTVLIPMWIARRVDIGFDLASTTTGAILQFAGLATLLSGAALFVASLQRFAVEGHGTLAPWDPPKRLVVRGPYRYVRNPMISGVMLVLVGESLLLRSRAHATWAAVFLVVNVLVITLYEEPHLTQVFGDDYRAYRANVPRVVPRLSAWSSRDDDRAV